MLWRQGSIQHCGFAISFFPICDILPCPLVLIVSKSVHQDAAFSRQNLLAWLFESPEYSAAPWEEKGFTRRKT
jgi:hypothetical protein